MKNQKKFYTYLILTILVMIIIFLLSKEDGDNSSMTSDSFVATFIGQFTLIIAKTFFPTFDPMAVVREAAHAFEFFVLAICSFNMFINYKDNKNVLIINIVFGVLYAISDEIHQLFVPERAFQLFDIMMDSLGFISGSLIVYFLNIIKLWRNNNE